MGLAESITDLCDELEEVAQTIEKGDIDGLDAVSLRFYIRQMRRLIKQSKEDQVNHALIASHTGMIGPMSGQVPSFNQTPSAAMIAKAEQQKVKSHIAAEEGIGASMTILDGGNAHGDYAPVEGMPVGAKTIVGGQVYVLKNDGKLHYSKEETDKYCEEMSKRAPGKIITG
jgi:hypothetical protein